MEISIKKTFIQPFCFSRRFNFTPELFYDGEQLDVVYTAKLLGVHFSSDLRWNTHISEMSKKANSKLFFIRRLKDLRASQSTLVEIYKLFIRLKFAAPLWTSSLSKKNIKDLEKLQARATDIICGYENRLSYEQRLGVLSLLSLKTRRWAITERFAVDCSKNPKFQHLFKERPYQNTRSKQKYCEIQARTKRYASSPIPTYISLVNKISQN